MLVEIIYFKSFQKDFLGYDPESSFRDKVVELDKI